MHYGQSREVKKAKKDKNREGFINFAEIGGICNMHHWLEGAWMSLILFYLKNYDTGRVIGVCFLFHVTDR